MSQCVVVWEEDVGVQALSGSFDNVAKRPTVGFWEGDFQVLHHFTPNATRFDQGSDVSINITPWV